VNIDIAASEDFSQAFNVGVLVKDKWGQKLFTTTQSFKTNQQLQVAVTMPARLLLGGAYSIDAALFIPKSVTLEYIKDVTTFTIVDSGSELAIFGDTDIGSFKVDCQWESQ